MFGRDINFMEFLVHSEQDFEQRADQFVAWYGDGSDGASPTKSQWGYITSRPSDEPVTLINFFKLRDKALYAEHVYSNDEDRTGQDAFDLYAAVSIPTLEKVGGKFLLVAPFEASFLGVNEDWDLVAIGSYPNNGALLDLFEDTDYRAVFHHRTAACERQKVFIVSG